MHTNVSFRCNACVISARLLGVPSHANGDLTNTGIPAMSCLFRCMHAWPRQPSIVPLADGVLLESGEALLG